MMGAVRLVQKHNFGCKGLAIATTQNRENTLYHGVLYVRKSDLYTILLDEIVMMGFRICNLPR